MAGAAQAVLDRGPWRGPRWGRASSRRRGSAVRWAVRWPVRTGSGGLSMRSARTSADVVGQMLAQHDGHQVEQAGAAPGRRRCRRPGRRTGRRSTAASSIAAWVVLGGRASIGGPRPVGPTRAAELGQFVQLEDQEGGQVGGDDHAFGVEGGGVVPAAVVAVLVVGQRGAGRAACGEPEVRPACQPVVGRRSVPSARAARSRVGAGGPRVQPWMGGLTKLWRTSEWVTESGSAPLSSWWSKGSMELVPGQLGRAGGQGEGVEAVVPAPDLVHPVLGHQHARAG